MYVAPGVWPAVALVAALGLLVRVMRRTRFPRVQSGWEKVRPISASSRAARSRGERRRVQDGLASRAEIRACGSARAVRKTTRVLRPSLAHLSAVEQWRHVRTSDVGMLLCTVGRQKVWSSLRDVVLHFGAPGCGKSGYLACRIVDFPGPAVVTSVRPDLYTNTHTFREGRGPVMVFNAAGITNIDNQVTFDPLTDCANPEAAAERARDMIPTAHGEAEHWAALARSALSALMHAAALGNHTMDDVLAWTANPKDHTGTIVRLLRRSPAPATLQAANQFLTNNDKTRSSITTSMMSALEWLSSTTARAAAGLDGDRQPFRVESLLAGTSTLYVIGRIDVNTEPLLAALTGYVGRSARRYAVTAPTGRLDPPLGLLLDEAARLGPPLPDWTSDMGGSGIPILACFQSLAQLVDVYGQEGADTILNNAGAILLGGGTKAAHDLEAWTKLAGERDENATTSDAQGRATGASQRSVPVLPPAQLANLAPQQVVLWRRGMPPALGRTTMVWERWDLHPPLLLRALRSATSSLHLRASVVSSSTVEPATVADVVEAPRGEVRDRVDA